MPRVPCRSLPLVFPVVKREVHEESAWLQALREHSAGPALYGHEADESAVYKHLRPACRVELGSRGPLCSPCTRPDRTQPEQKPAALFFLTSCDYLMQNQDYIFCIAFTRTWFFSKNANFEM